MKLERSKLNLLQLILDGTKSYSQLQLSTGLSDEPLQRHLKELRKVEYIRKDESDGRPVYEITEMGRLALLQESFNNEEDTEVIKRTLLTTALRRAYNLLSDLRYVLSRKVRGVTIDERAKVNEEFAVIRELMLKHDRTLDRGKIAKEESEAMNIGISEVLTGGFVWGPRLVRRGMIERIESLERLAGSLSDDSVKEQLRNAIEVAKAVALKIETKQSSSKE